MNPSRWILAAALLIAGPCAGAERPAAAEAPAPAAPGGEPGKEKTVPDFDPKALWDGRKIVPFRALDDPKMVKAAEADFLEDGEYVLGLTLNGESRAYPTRFVWWHHVINDRIGGSSFAVTYCSVCNTGIRYDRTVNAQVLKLDFYGLYNGVVSLCDRETETVVLQISGRAVKGPLAGIRLKADPLLDTTWGEWRRLHPDTLVMSPDTPYARYYRPKGQAEPRGHERFPAPFFRPTLTRGDKRLPPFDKVLGVILPPSPPGPEREAVRRAYPIKAVQEAGGVVNDTAGSISVAVFLDPETQTAVALFPVLEGRKLTFEARKPDGRVAFYDRETGSRWNIEGRAEDGPLAGKSLARLENHLSQWYGWAAYYPDTTIYGRTDPPQPGDPFEAAK